MPQVDPKILAEFKSAEAQTLRTICASDKTWDVFQRAFDAYKFLLANRKKLQAFARRCENKPEQFCEVLMGKSWFAAPTELSASQVQQATAMICEITEFITSHANISDLDGKRLFKGLQALGAHRPGRKRSPVFLQARALKQAMPELRIHDICQQLSPAYSKMTSHQRRGERERIRKGMERLADNPAHS